MGACGADEGPAGIRDASLIGLGVTVGLRIAEAAVLALLDYDRQTGELVLNGKGRKQPNRTRITSTVTPSISDAPR